jgi:MFS family permease
MKHRSGVTLAMFFTLVPVTLLVPGLRELVVIAHGGTDGDAHAFMTVNMLAGMLAVPVVMRFQRRWADLRGWVAAALALDALVFAAMYRAPSLPVLLVLRGIDGALHLPAVTLLMVAANRQAGVRRGGPLGALATAIMLGVAVGSPLGGWLVERLAGGVYLAGAVLLLAAAGLAARMGPVPAPAVAPRSRYAWNRRSAETWVPLAYAFLDRFSIGIFVSTFTLFLARVHAVSPSRRGLLIALFMLPFAALCWPAGRLADRIGWFVPMITGNLLFGLTFASYGVVPTALLPVVMVASGVFSALMFAPNLVLISDLARRGDGEGLFGAFQVAGSLGFLAGPIAGGILVTVTRGAHDAPAYRTIFALVGFLELLLAAGSFVTLRSLAAGFRRERATGDVVVGAP